MSADPSLDPCGCCGAETPEPTLENRPGLPALSYRIGTHADFLRRMVALLPNQRVGEGGARPLAALTTRGSDDPALALLDAWAAVGDVLTFYQERIANEGFLRTATERRSVLELARAIGYELRPGVAAGTYLSFTVESAPGAPGEAVVPRGTRAQSVPAQGQRPQPFETSAEIETRAAWNALHPRLTRPQTLAIQGGQLHLVGLDGALSEAGQIYLAGAQTALRAGERLVIALPKAAGGVDTLSLRIRGVAYEPESRRTRVELAPNPQVPAFVFPLLTLAIPFLQPVAFSGTAVATHVLGQSWRERDLRSFLTVQRWSPRDLVRQLSAPPPPTPPSPSPVPLDTGVFALRTQVGVFGNSAPDYDSLPQNQTTSDDRAVSPPYPHDWDAGSGWPVWKSPKTDTYWSDAADSDADLYLERSVPGLVSGGWAVLEHSTGTHAVYQVTGVNEVSLTGFSLSGRATGLQLGRADGTTLENQDKSATYTVRRTTVHAQSEKLALAELPITDELRAGDGWIMLGGLVLELQVGQPVVLTGERADAPGVVATEVLLLSDVIHQGGFTTLYFQDGLQYPYVRGTVEINANTVAATHGETVVEVLGSGDGSLANQRFTLKKPPLTHVSASTPSGAETTLSVRVDQVLWREVASLYGLGPRDPCYTVRLEDDGTTTVTFGDGVSGARLPTGAENVVATYRSGIGPAGEVAAGSISLLQTRPPGIRAVTNPVPASGAQPPEALDDARRNASLAVLTFGRIVSERDYEDFARTFAGIGKAHAVTLWSGEHRLVHLTVASASGAVVDESSALFQNLVDAIDLARNPIEPAMVQSFQPLQFNLSAQVLVDARYRAELVLAAVEAALLAAFSFAERGFAQDVTAAEVVTAIQGVEGVIATDLDALYLVTEAAGSAAPTLASRLAALPTRWEGGQVRPAQLLLVNPVGITLEEMQP